jgi:hypothetical protein
MAADAICVIVIRTDLPADTRYIALMPNTLTIKGEPGTRYRRDQRQRR